MRLYPVASPHPLRATLVTLGAVAVALIVTGVLFLMYGVNPLSAYATLLTGTLFDSTGLAEVARRTIPLLLIGAGLTLAYRVQFFNIGAEGQLLLGALAASGVALFVPLGPLTLPGMFVAGALAGGLWAWLAAWLRERFNVNEILSTLMLNYVAASAVIYFINGPWKGKDVRGYVYSDVFAPGAQLPVVPGTQVHWPTLLLGALLAIGLQLLLTRSTLGFALRVVGENPGAARYVGLPAGRLVGLVALISGGAAGLAGVGEVAGIHHRLIEPVQLSLGYGFTAVIVAYLARGNPLAVLLSAPAMAVILAGGDVLKIELNMPFRVVDVFSGVTLLCLIGGDVFVRSGFRRPAPHQLPNDQTPNDQTPNNQAPNEGEQEVLSG